MQLLVGPTFICSTATGVNSLFKKEKAKTIRKKEQLRGECGQGTYEDYTGQRKDPSTFLHVWNFHTCSSDWKYMSLGRGKFRSQKIIRGQKWEELGKIIFYCIHVWDYEKC